MTTLESLIPILHDIYECKNNNHAYFVGGSLVIDNLYPNEPCAMLNISKGLLTRDTTLMEAPITRELTGGELYWLAKLYAKYKTPTHRFYSKAIEVIREFEKPEEENHVS